MLLEFKIEQTITIDLERVYLNIESLFFLKILSLTGTNWTQTFGRAQKRIQNFYPKNNKKLITLTKFLWGNIYATPSLLHWLFLPNMCKLYELTQLYTWVIGVWCFWPENLWMEFFFISLFSFLSYLVQRGECIIIGGKSLRKLQGFFSFERAEMGAKIEK